MGLLEILGYFSIFCVGLVLALIGSGGSILTVPILVYLFGQEATLATSGSLVLVGTTALVGSALHLGSGLIRYKTGFFFLLPSTLGVYSVRRFVLPSLPEEMSLGSFFITRDQMILGVFSMLMIASSFFMLRKDQDDPSLQSYTMKPKPYYYPLVAIEGFLVGSLTGFVGAGGGFLIIPALVLLAGLKMRQAAATSLMIIAGKSLLGVLGDWGTVAFDAALLGSLCLVAIAGMLVGSHLRDRLPSQLLMKGFGYFLLIMGLGILWQQF